jgi:undecaprenyl-diphosphatase
MSAPEPPLRTRHPRHSFALFLVTALLVVTLPGAALAAGARFPFDHALLLAMRDSGPDGMLVPAGPGWLPGVIVALTALGSTSILLPAAAIAAIPLMLRRQWLSVAMLAGCAISSPLAVQGFKHVIGRGRPELIDRLIDSGYNSFPSGHATNTMSICLIIALLLGQLVPLRKHRTALIICAVVLSLATGLSRIYLGVHWPSDILAGWCFGAMWALAWYTLGEWIRHGTEEHRPGQA